MNVARKRTFRERVDIARKTPFSLPIGITSEKVLLSDGVWAWVFSHHQLGQIGRVVILAHPKGSQWCYEVSGNHDDPMTLKRRAAFEPLAKYISNTMETVCGDSEPTTEPYTLKPETVTVGAETMTCNKCDKLVAAMFVAPDAYTADRLEDYARMAFSKVKELNVPAWIVGAEKEVVINGDFAGEALVLKVWPTRETAKIVSSIEFNSISEALVESHCL